MYIINQCKLSVKTYGKKAKRTRLEKGIKIGFSFSVKLLLNLFLHHIREERKQL